MARRVARWLVTVLLVPLAAALFVLGARSDTAAAAQVSSGGPGCGGRATPDRD